MKLTLESCSVIYIGSLQKAIRKIINRDYPDSSEDEVYNLTNISLAFKKVIERVEGKKFLYIDSLSAMLIHNTPEIFVRFIHGLITSMRLASISGLLLSLTQQTDNSIKTEVANLCDKTIMIS